MFILNEGRTLHIAVVGARDTSSTLHSPYQQKHKGKTPVIEVPEFMH